MPNILIADDNKSSVVMTSEIVKDHVSSVVIDVVSTGKDCLERMQQKTFDLVVVDFDLPDADGVSLAKLIRASFAVPILITAFEEEVVSEAVKAEMFAYSDVCSWVKKPVVTEDFAAKIDKFLIKKHSITKRFMTDFPLEITALGPTKTKKPAVVKGRVLDLSIDGIGIRVSEPLKRKIGDEVSLILDFRKPDSKKAKSNSTQEVEQKTKIKARLVWMDLSKKKAGFKFNQLTEKTFKYLETILRASEEIS